MSQFSLDIKSLKVGNLELDGDAAKILTSPGEIKENTVKVTQADATQTKIKAAGKSQPVIVINEDGDITVEYDIMTFDVEVMQNYMGGYLTGTAPNKIWNKPSKSPIIEKTHEIVDSQGATWLFPRVHISATLVGVFSPTDVNVIRVKGTVLEPAKVGVTSVSYGNPA
ncbi:hypothetical protein [Pedobacter sp. UYP1]|uniref:hypothetical protein n=1 Tax=Pedobacter sp. UYP1 TaxID=1756396 RepID=UPI00339165FE